MDVEGEPREMCSDLKTTLGDANKWGKMLIETSKNMTTKVFLSNKHGEGAYLLLNWDAQVIEKTTFSLNLKEYPFPKQILSNQVGAAILG